MKKLLTLFTLLLTVYSGAWGDTESISWSITTNTLTITPTITPSTDAKLSNASTSISLQGFSQTSSQKDGYCKPFYGTNVAFDASDKYAYISFKVADGYTFTPSSLGMTVYSHGTGNIKYKVIISDSKTTPTSVTSNEIQPSSGGESAITFADGAFTGKAFEGTVTIKLYAYNYANTSSGKRTYIKSPITISGTVEASAPSTPTLTGAWKIGDDVVTSASVVQGGSATMPTFTVGATSGDPSGKYNVSYAFKSGYQSGIFDESDDKPTIVNGQPSIASTAVTGTATIVATLTTTDAESFAQPTTNTFEYTVTINAPAAPTFSPDASAVVSGTEITMTSPDGGEIWYTTNGEDPTESNKTVYNADAKPTITGTTTIKAIARVNGYSSAVTTADYTIIAMLTQNSVSTSRTWDWSKLSAVGALTDVTNPTNAEDFVMANMDGVRYSDFNLGFNSNFTQEMAQEIVISNTQYVKRSGNGDSFQNGTIKINFAVPGKLTVYFTGTNNNQKQDGSEDPRYLVVNSSKGTVGTNGTTQVNETFDVVVGDNTISFETGKPLRIQKLVFVEAVPVEVSALGYATFASDKALDFTDKSIKAYKATVAGTTVDFTQVNVVPAGEGVLLYADGGATVNVPVATADADDFTGNKLVRGTGASLTYEEGAEYYILANETAGIGFYKANGNVVATNKAYLDLTGTNAKSFVLPGGETDGIRSIENGKLRIENSNYYNLAGQRVGKDYKGIVIVNGKKMLNK